MNHDSYTDLYISDILESIKTVAMVGASANTNRPSYFAMKYMLAKGFTVHPINPGQAGKEILGQTVYADLADVPAPVDMVDIFRNSEAAGEIVDYAIGLAPKLAIKVIWMQLGVRNDAAAARAEAAGLKVVMNRCPKIEYGRLTGELGWAGVNTRKISNNRPQMAAFGVQDHRLKPRTCAVAQQGYVARHRGPGTFMSGSKATRRVAPPLRRCPAARAAGTAP